ncbi:PEP-CTERM sorting domain-containing protein [Massilia sp. TWP1-3-3]|uniref:PEP-CTERM sorting domain-containing protein n=1 Tax=Massilia sp. TWP1-3-3 TaxID=2804573 RepID=UPI003CEC51FB
MKFFVLKSLALAAALAGQAHAAVITVTPADMSASPALNAWYLTNLRSTQNGYTSTTAAGITASAPRSGNGSVAMSLTDGSGKADFAYYWGFVGGRTLGTLDALSYDWYRNSGAGAPAHLQPALRLAYDTDGDSRTTTDRGYLVWEQVYNGGGMVTGQWNSSNIVDGNFWQRQTSPGNTVEDYSTTLAEWMNGPRPAGPADQLSAATAITGIEFGIGSGWNGSFGGFVDNVGFGFGNQKTVFNFETAPAAAAVPEPGSTLLFALGLAGFGATRLRRRS